MIDRYEVGPDDGDQIEQEICDTGPQDSDPPPPDPSPSEEE